MAHEKGKRLLQIDEMLFFILFVCFVCFFFILQRLPVLESDSDTMTREKHREEGREERRG